MSTLLRSSENCDAKENNEEEFRKEKHRKIY